MYRTLFRSVDFFSTCSSENRSSRRTKQHRFWVTYKRCASVLTGTTIPNRNSELPSKRLSLLVQKKERRPDVTSKRRVLREMALLTRTVRMILDDCRKQCAYVLCTCTMHMNECRARKLCSTGQVLKSFFTALKLVMQARYLLGFTCSPLAPVYA